MAISECGLAKAAAVISIKTNLALYMIDYIIVVHLAAAGLAYMVTQI